MMWEDGDHVWISENRFHPADVHWEWTKSEKVRGGGTVRINDSFTIHFPSISRISISWSFFDYASGKTTRRYVFSGGESREE